MTVLDWLERARGEPGQTQLLVNAFVDAFRRASLEQRVAMITEGPDANGRLEGLASSLVSHLCREAEMPAPEWVTRVRSSEPFFVFPGEGFALRVRLMLESPPAFRIRNVFVPENYLSRA
jgi:hypothetical protein